MKLKLLATLGLVILSVVLVGCWQTTAEQPDPNAPVESKDGVYRQLFGQLQKTASVASDNTYANLARRLPKKNSTVASKGPLEYYISYQLLSVKEA